MTLQEEISAWLDADDGWKKGEARWVDGLTLCIEGSPLYVVMNYGEPSWALDTEIRDIAKKHGRYIELGSRGLFLHFLER